MAPINKGTPSIKRYFIKRSAVDISVSMDLEISSVLNHLLKKRFVLAAADGLNKMRAPIIRETKIRKAAKNLNPTKRMS